MSSPSRSRAASASIRTLPLLLVALVLALPGVASALPTHVTVGIGDQKPGMFSDPRYAKLGVRDARVLVPWDWRTIDYQEGELEAWMQAARRARTRVLVTFSHSRGEGRRRVLPTPERFKYEFVRFRERYPWVRDFAVWNEANHCGEPTCHRPRLVAAYYRKLRQACSHCTLLPAALLDMPNMVRYARQVRAALKVEPKVWGLHNYIDANRLSTSRTRALLRTVRGRIWLTETGGLVDRRRRRKETVGFREGPHHAARVTRFVLERVVRLSRRIDRVYLYHWDTKTRRDSWDSALVGPDGPRPALRVLARALASQRAAVARAEARRASSGRSSRR